MASVTEEEMALQDCLFRRVGELHSHLCRFDVQLRALIGMLSEESVLRDMAESGPLEQRIRIVERLAARTLPDAIARQFGPIHEEIRPVLQRQAIGAHHPVLQTLSHESSGSERMARALGGVEGDILTAVKLHMQLSMLATRIGRHTEAHAISRNPVPLRR